MRPRSAGIDTIHVDVRRDIFRFVVDVPAAHAVQVAAVLAGLTAPQPHSEDHDWVQLGRDGFNAGLEHPSPLANPTVAAAISANMSEPDRVAEITAQYRRGWDAASEDSARAGLRYSYTAPNQPAPPSQPVYFVWDHQHEEAVAILREHGHSPWRRYRALSADGHTRLVSPRWVKQQQPATTAQAAYLLQQMILAGYRPHVLASMPN
ncbi:hypothetical protein [Nocardia sp. CA-119907]|uniref:hypothetical protein n=1 Tax=Nocardia sp. CA-119907 TaxID=3239973 RepID=UPI003D984207